jgi:hypothetical protein
MRVLVSGWIMTRIAPTLLIGGAVSLAAWAVFQGDAAQTIELVGFAVAMVACLVWAAGDVVVVTRSTIYRGFRSLELSKIHDLVLVPANRFIAPNISSTQGYEIVALTDEGAWRVGLFGPDMGRWGGVHPKIRARLAALRAAILR